MNIDRIYIISYFGNDIVREKRKQYHRHQVDWCLSQNIKIYVLAQEYLPQDYDDRITYLKHDNTLKLPSAARNICLQHFYESDSNFAIFADNDAILYSGDKYCDSTDFISKFNRLSKLDLYDIDFFYPLNPGRMPFSKMYNENILFTTHFNFQRGMEPKSMYVLKNLYKSYNKKIFFDEDNFGLKDGYLIAHEDTDFACQLLKNGYGVYRLNNIVLKEFGSSNSTWLNQKDNRRKKSAELGRDILCRKYNLLRKNNRMSYKPLYHISNKQAVINVCKKT